MKHPPVRRPHSSVTMTDVARRAGVSPMTVSRVINSDRHVSPATRARVHSAIAQLHYSPNAAARSLAGAAPIRIGLLYSNPSESYLSEFLLGSLDAGRNANIQLIVEKCGVGARDIDAVTQLMASGVDGLILPCPLCESAPLIAMLRANAIPAVLVGSGGPPADLPAVTIDQVAAAQMMTRHILTLGHKRIGFIAGCPTQLASAGRLAGYRAALAEAGLPFDDSLVAHGRFTYRSGLDAAEALLNRADRPAAIFACNDDMAAAVIAVAHRRGLTVPGDLTVCGFDDTTLATATWPAVTTIHQPIAAMAGAAVGMLIRDIRARRAGDPPIADHLRLDVRLVRRQSDAPPRHKSAG